VIADRLVRLPASAVVDIGAYSVLIVALGS
jgi:hypothetical protein